MNRRLAHRRPAAPSSTARSIAGGPGYYNPFAPVPQAVSDRVGGGRRDDHKLQDDRDGEQQCDGQSSSSTVRHLDETVQKLTQELQGLKRKLKFLQKIDLSDESSQGDVSLITKYGKVIKAHRYVLLSLQSHLEENTSELADLDTASAASKSSIFKKMFDTNMSEKCSGEIHIEDIELPVLKAVVEFLYTAEISFTNEATASEVFKAAHKYDIPELQADCETYLSNSVTEENLSEMLKISHIYETERLKERSIQVFKDNFDEVHARVLRDLLSRGQSPT